MKSLEQKGFTLIEVMMYIGISTMLFTTLVSFSIMLSLVQAKTTEDVRSEINGEALARIIETDIQNNIPINSVLESASSSLSNFILQTFATSSLTTISFSYEKHDFTLTFLNK